MNGQKDSLQTAPDREDMAGLMCLANLGQYDLDI